MTALAATFERFDGVWLQALAPAFALTLALTGSLLSSLALTGNLLLRYP